MGVFQAIGRGFSLSAKLMSVALVFFVFNFIIGLAMAPFTGPDKVGNTQAALMTFLLSLVSVVIFIFLQGGALALIRDLLKNNSFNLADLAVNGKKYYLRILGLFLIIIAMALVIIIILALIASGILAVANNLLTKSLITAIIVVISLIAVVLLLFPIYIIVIEESGPVAALKKGVSLSLANFWRALGLFLTVLVISFLLAFAVGAAGALATGGGLTGAGRVVMIFINSILQSYLSIVMMTAFMAYYMGLAEEGRVSGPSGPAA